MNWTSLAPLLPFAFVMSITPGPNNLMVAASGVNFGFRRTLPHMLGITLGFPIMLAAIGFGLGAVIARFPVLQLTLKYGGCAYLLYTAYQMARSTQSKSVGAPLRPKSVLEAAAFQWINPKAWMMGVSSMATYASASAAGTQVIGMSMVWGLMAMIAVIIWTLFGALIAERLHDPRALRLFNLTMAGLLVASLLPVLFH